MANLMHYQTMEIHPQRQELKGFVASVPLRFERGEGTVIYKGRNELRKLTYEGKAYVVKAFRKPPFINRLVYGFLRPSKAKRSYENALRLLQLGIGTPVPVGYVNVRNGLLFTRSYYISDFSECLYTWNDLFLQDFDCIEEVSRALGRLTALLHEHQLAHKDFGRGNILFSPGKEGVKIDLVDLNRMYHGTLDIKKGCKNFERLPATPQMHRWIAEEYAKARGFDVEECVRLMQEYRSVQPGKIDDKY